MTTLELLINNLKDEIYNQLKDNENFKKQIADNEWHKLQLTFNIKSSFDLNTVDYNGTTLIEIEEITNLSRRPIMRREEFDSPVYEARAL